METAISAGREIGLPVDRIIMMQALGIAGVPTQYPSLNELVAQGINEEPHFVEKSLALGEAKTKVAFYCMSSGTTGKPKAVVIQHYAIIANVVQLSVFHEDRLQPGDVASGSGYFSALLPLLSNF